MIIRQNAVLMMKKIITKAYVCGYIRYLIGAFRFHVSKCQTCLSLLAYSSFSFQVFQCKIDMVIFH